VNLPLVTKTVQTTLSVDEGYAHINQSKMLNRNSAGAANSHLAGYSTGDASVDAFIVDSSRRYRIDPLLIYAQMSQESSFKKRATSYKGASGLMQLMPATARRLGVDNIYDPQQNIEGGVKYMRILLDMFDDDLNLALAGYNAGEGAVIKYGYQIPPYNETQDYVQRISSRYRSMTNVTMAARSLQK
jgi:soluble lytic murein transglycosylase-like protein